MVVVKLYGTGKYGYKKINPEAGLIFLYKQLYSLRL